MDDPSIFSNLPDLGLGKMTSIHGYLDTFLKTLISET